jgi:transcriptional regulator with XRE-family HTH domain
MRIEGRFIERERTLLNITTEDLAYRSGVSVHDIVAIEAGFMANVTDQTASRLASALGLEVFDLSKEEPGEGEAGLFRC